MIRSLSFCTLCMKYKSLISQGNDLARVLRWGSGYTGTEDPLSLLRDVIDAEEIRLDRWTVVFHPEDKQDEPKEQLSKQLPGKWMSNIDPFSM